MISRVKIENYKSIESADFEARRVNVFIGEPNSGKSNLLEAIGLFSDGIVPISQELLRIRQPADLFFDRGLERVVNVKLEPDMEWELNFTTQGFRGIAIVTSTRANFGFNPAGHHPMMHGGLPPSAVRYYRYRTVQKEESRGDLYGHLATPYGINLPSLLLTNKAVRESVSAFFQEKGFRLELRPQDNEIQMTKDVDGVLYSFPFESISETMRRIVFYKAALESNKDAILVFDEPESNTFPFYTKYLAERIALDTSNQFFLTTHNPYVLMSIIEKTPSVDLAVYVTRMQNYRTELRLLDSTQLGDALELGMSVFFNLDSYFED